jgi:hypothetical protein
MVPNTRCSHAVVLVISPQAKCVPQQVTQHSAQLPSTARNRAAAAVPAEAQRLVVQLNQPAAGKSERPLRRSDR